jgi:hypothetical protein
MRKESLKIARAFAAGVAASAARTSTDGQAMFLHGNLIAKREADGSIWVTLGGMGHRHHPRTGQHPLPGARIRRALFPARPRAARGFPRWRGVRDLPPRSLGDCRRRWRDPQHPGGLTDARNTRLPRNQNPRPPVPLFCVVVGRSARASFPALLMLSTASGCDAAGRSYPLTAAEIAALERGPWSARSAAAFELAP